MSDARALGLARAGVVLPWLGAVMTGAALGVVVALLLRSGLVAPLVDLVGGSVATLNHRVGPVWIAMLGVGVRVGWLAVRAARTRQGKGAVGEPVRPELAQLAPVFAALGLCGTVWGLSAAFDALDGRDFLERLPALLAGLGAAMTSTLVGLALQIGTLLLAAFNPAWSRLDVHGADTPRFVFDGVELGEGEPGRARMLEALGARGPEALFVRFARRVAADERRDLLALVWKHTDAAVPIREGRL